MNTKYNKKQVYVNKDKTKFSNKVYEDDKTLKKDKVTVFVFCLFVIAV